VTEHGYNLRRPAEGWVVWWRYRSLEVCLQMIAQRAIAREAQRMMEAQMAGAGPVGQPVPPPPAALGITDHEMQMGRRRQQSKKKRRRK
jgi:hypothetical protein